jgi:adhesin/invasin
VTTTAPTVTVTAPAAGTPSLLTSTVAANPISIAVGGTSTVTMTTRDATGTPLTTGGATVTFALGSGTGQGTFGTVTDNGNGTYSATFTGTVAGTNTIVGSINGQPLTSSPGAIIVTAAAATPDPDQSIVEVSPTSIVSGGTATVTLKAFDSTGTALSTGGATVTFGLGAGSGQGTFGTVSDLGDGTYTATFTATDTGTNTITATLNGAAVTTPAPTITIT